MKHLVRDEGVAGSNPATPTTIFDGIFGPWLTDYGRGWRLPPYKEPCPLEKEGQPLDEPHGGQGADAIAGDGAEPG